MAGRGKVDRICLHHKASLHTLMRTRFWTSVFTLAPVLVAMLVIATSIAHAQTEELLAEKVTRLQTTAIRNKGIVDLESSTFDDVLAMPRNFSVVILFTAISSEFQCVPCKNFDPEYRLVASTWSKLSDKSRLFFGIIDFKKGQAIFQKFGMNSAPSVLYFSAGEHQSDFDRYEFSRHGFKAEPFAAWLSAKSGVPLQVPRPFDFVAFASKLLSLLGMFIIGRFLYSQAGKILHSKHLWAAISLFTIFVMISGHMWNQIRNPPYSMKGRDGSTGYIAAGFQNQFGLETQIIAVIYALLSGAVITLISSIPRIDDRENQRTAVWLRIGFFGLMFSILLYIFRLKNPGYPYRFLF